ncbi:MAG: ATP-binding protein [Clostridia bacterium]|nr:ATP-binding protein [Clostridia bacterium]
MGKIKVLTPDIFNKISAGEVVENPAAVVKELVENSIDAGAMRIVVETVDGGMKSITVTDNGCGMEADDIDVCFLKHATSKILSAEEIFGVTTLGFRGEALASIAAVSEVKLTTRHAVATWQFALLQSKAWLFPSSLFRQTLAQPSK